MITIIEARRDALWGPHRIGWALGEAPSTMHRVLRRNRLPRLADLDRATRTVVRYQRDAPGGAGPRRRHQAGADP